jgi:hypothetical protein
VSFVWSLNILAGLSAIAAFRRGLLAGAGILIDILLFVPMIWFAIWYQRHRHVDSTTVDPTGSSQ